MDFSELLYNHKRQATPKRGSLLVAEPLMQGDVFSRSVVMILDVDSDRGHLGLIMNKPTEYTLGELVPEMELERNIPVFSGGPVDGSRLFMLHTLGDLFEGSAQILPGIYVGGKIEDVMEYLIDGGETDGKIRFYLGYSGWSGGQLRGEIDRNIWAVEDNAGADSSRLLRGRGNEYWRREVKRLGEEFRSWLVVPQDPMLN